MLTRVGVGKGRQGHSSASRAHIVCIHTHTPQVFWELSQCQPLSMSTRCSFAPGTPVQLPPTWAEGLQSGTGGPGGSTHTDCYPNNDLYFQFSERLCFHLKRCCLLLFDLNKLKDNRIQMKYISTLILHSLAPLPGAAARVDPVTIRCPPGSE